MERLTEYMGNGENYESINPIDTPYEYGKANLQALINKLAAYEDAEEQGLLLRLPCKAGDTAWYVSRSGIHEVEIDSFVFAINLFINVSYYIGCERFGKTLTPYKTLFFSREEAEAKLAEMEEKDGE